MLSNLKLTDVIRCRRIGRAAKKSGKAPDIAEVIALRLPRETAHIHIFDHPLAQTSRRRWQNRLGHGRLLCNERSHHPQGTPPKGSNKTCPPSQPNAITTSTNPAIAGSFSGPTKPSQECSLLWPAA